MKDKTHWRKYHDTDYLGAYSLIEADVKELTVTINKVDSEQVKGSDGRNEECVVAHLKGQKPMILNVTNCKIISKIYDTPFIEDWAGKSITIYIAKVNAFGELMDALRIRPKKPNTKPELKPESKKWKDAIKALANGPVTMEQIKNKYSLSAENELTLFDQAGAKSNQ